MTFTCKACDEQFEADCPFGDDLTCPLCGAVNETEYEEDWDNFYAWTVALRPPKEK